MQYFGKEKDITKISMDLNSRAQSGTVGDKTVREKKMFPALVVILQYCNKTYLDDYITFSSISCFLACCRLGFFFCRETICHPCFWFSASTPGSCERSNQIGRIMIDILFVQVYRRSCLVGHVYCTQAFGIVGHS